MEINRLTSMIMIVFLPYLGAALGCAPTRRRPRAAAAAGGRKTPRAERKRTLKSSPRVLWAALICAAMLNPAQALTLKIATVEPDGTDSMKAMKRAAATIAEKTEGRVKFKFYPGGVMGGEQSVRRKIRAHQLQGGAFTSGGLADVYPDIQMLNLPMLFDSFDEVDYVRKQVDPLLKKNLEAHGFVLLGIAEQGFTYILSTEPIDDLATIRRHRLWAPEGDPMAEETYRSMGLKPVFLPIADVYTGLQTGMIDAVTMTPKLTLAFQWHSKLAYLTDMPLIYIVGLLAIDKREFERIDAADQAIVRQEIARVFDSLDKSARSDNLLALEALQRQGFEIVTPEAREVEHWRQLAEQSIEHLIASGALTREGVETVRHYLQDYRDGNR